jgi:hypothetical protein
LTHTAMLEKRKADKIIQMACMGVVGSRLAGQAVFRKVLGC